MKEVIRIAVTQERDENTRTERTFQSPIVGPPTAEQVVNAIANAISQTNPVDGAFTQIYVTVQ
jgi:hypothetical protein